MANYIRLTLPTSLLITTLGLGLTVDAQAVTQQRNFVQNATGACQAALPVYEGNIRKRPLAVQNEGTAPAFVSCSFMGTTGGVGGVSSIRQVVLGADNNTGSPVDLTCTLVDAYSGIGPAYFPKTITLPANTKSNFFSWTALDDNGGLNFLYTTNSSCNLPPGTGLSLIIIYYAEDVGA